MFDTWTGTSENLKLMQLGCLEEAVAGSSVEAKGSSHAGERLRERLRLNSSLRILVADGDAEFLQLLGEALSGFAHYTAATPLLADAEAARCAARAAPWDVALISLDLLRFEGLIAITRLRDCFPRLRIVATMAVAEADVLITASYAGANECVIKREISAMFPMADWIPPEVPDMSGRQ